MVDVYLVVCNGVSLMGCGSLEGALNAKELMQKGNKNANVVIKYKGQVVA